MKKILITGVSGMLGSNIAHRLRNKFDIMGLYHTFPVEIDGIRTFQCDLQQKNHVQVIVDKHQPDIIIHCASLTNVDYCEMHRDKTYSVNVVSSENICRAVDDQKIIFISSDSVYDGTKQINRESDTSQKPRNYYGYTKLKSEKIISKLKNWLILRTNIFGWNVQPKMSIGEWILEESKSGKTINGFTDAMFSSIYTMELARIIEVSLIKDIRGIYNCASADSCSKYDFVKKMSSKFGLDSNKLKPISIRDFDFKAERGKNLSLNVEKLNKALNYELPTIDQSIDQFYRDYNAGIPAVIKKYKTDRKKKRFINYGRQWLSKNDLKAVHDILSSDFLTQGPEVGHFEDALSRACDAKYCVAVNSGTAALHIACKAAGIGVDDEVITSPITFVASANCVVYCGGTPVFADIDKRTYNLCPEELEKKITDRTKAVIVVHFAGQCCDMDQIVKIVRAAEIKYGHKIYIIEDACHALGSQYKGTVVGSSVYSDLTVMSFHPVKHITTGEGGAVFTNQSVLFDKLSLYRSHGITNEVAQIEVESPSEERTKRFDQPWYYEQLALGYNYRLTDIQCGLGVSQLNRLPAFIERRRQIVEIYNDSFQDIEYLTTPFELSHCNSNFHLYVLLVDFGKLRINRTEFVLYLRKQGIQTQVHYIPVHTQPYYQNKFGTGWGDCPMAEQYYEKCISIPLFPAMTDSDVKHVIETIKTIPKIDLG